MSGPLGFTLNGRPVEVSAPAERMLIDVLREELGLTGAKVGCDQATCGSCTVLVDDRPVAACATFAFEVEGARVETVEGLAGADGTLDLVQAAFRDHSAFQCGYCTPGMIMLATALLRRHPQPDHATIRTWMSANICRCTGYKVILEAVEDAAGRSGQA